MVTSACARESSVRANVYICMQLCLWRLIAGGMHFVRYIILVLFRMVSRFINPLDCGSQGFGRRLTLGTQR